MSQIFSYTLTRRRGQKTLRLTVKPPAQVCVSANLTTPRYLIDRFVSQHQSWICRQLDRLSALPQPAPLSATAKSRLRALTLQAISPHLSRYAQRLNVAYRQVRLKSARSRWGSCSTAGNLNFNLRLGLLPAPLVEYVVLHELAHLRHPNHSPAFWSLVAAHMPDFAARRRRLRHLFPEFLTLNTDVL